MAARTPSPSSSDSKLASLLITVTVILVGVLLIGGYWLQQQRAAQATQQYQADVYDNYLYSTSSAPPPRSPELPASFVEAQQLRQHLLNHPAVTPGPGFNKPGVQTTGKSIVDAIDQAKGQ